MNGLAAAIRRISRSHHMHSTFYFGGNCILGGGDVKNIYINIQLYKAIKRYIYILKIIIKYALIHHHIRL